MSLKFRSLLRFRKQPKNHRCYSNEIKLDKSTKYSPKIFSGIQPTGQIHLGNYAGAIKPWLKLQEDNEDMTICVVDLHAITLPQDPKTLSKNILEVTATLLACGIDPNRTVLYQQSSVPQHTELNWYLGCISTMARLAHLPQFKEKSAALKEVPLGLFVYPVLQAADILLYKATHVPVGEDQFQHIQLTQDLARMFNKRHGMTFPIPHSVVIDDFSAKLRSLRNPAKKMSKSDPDPKNRVCLTDTSDEISSKIRKAVTDFTSQITYDPEKRPGVSNLIHIHSIITGKSPEDICEEARNLDTLKYKQCVADCVIEHVKPIQEKIAQYSSDQGYLLDVLEAGSLKCREIAEKTITEVREKLGLQVKFDKRQKVKASM